MWLPYVVALCGCTHKGDHIGSPLQSPGVKYGNIFS